MLTANFNAYASYVTDSLHQWDINHVLTVTGLNLSVAPEVHFSNADMDRAIVRQATMTNHVVSVNIPNSVLQDPLTIHAYVGIYEGDTFKVVEKIEIPVIPRTKPSDYQIQDNDEEIYSFNALENLFNNTVRASIEKYEAAETDLEQSKRYYDTAADTLENAFDALENASSKFDEATANFEQTAALGLASFRNLLDNSDFTNPINQRGVTGGTLGNYAYFLDRWSSVGDGLTYSLDSNGLTCTAGKIRQVHIADRFLGKTLTLAYRDASSNVYCMTFDVPSEATPQTIKEETLGNTKISVYFNTNGYFTVQAMINASVTFKNIALYEGAYTAETLPPYLPKDYVVELAECQRYYLPFAVALWPCGNGYVSGNGGRCVIPIPRKMRALPSIIGGEAWQHITPNGYTGDYTATVAEMTDTHIRIHTSGTSSTQVPASFQTKTDAAFSADL